ncbi:MAG: YcaO-like family protein [Thermodesulfobacteriota bacterium]|nr:YcaO-like family protein [Thermodesulfobacteriota bacterium]
MMDVLKLKDAYKQFTADQDKILPPGETVARFKKRAAEIGVDLLQETRRIDTGRLGIPVYYSVCGDDARRLTGTNKQMGKGATPDQAEASAVMELAERYSFYRFADTADNFTIDTLESLGNKALPFDVIARSVHDGPGESDIYEGVKAIFETLPLRWTPAHNLTTGETTLVPFDWFFMINEFNGTSAGNCNEEAICQGICEVVERHVSCLAGQQRQSLPGIIPESATDPAVTDMLDKYRDAGIRLWISDLSYDTGIPTVGVLAWDPDTFPEQSEIVWTAGTAPNPEKAMSRALTETAQLGGDFNTGACFVESGMPKFRQIDEAAFITGAPVDRPIQALSDLSDENIKTEIERCLAALSENGMTVLVINTTDPMLDIPAFYTTIPGTRFYQRAENASAAMFTAKLIAEQFLPEIALPRLSAMQAAIGDAYFLDFYVGMCHLNAGDVQAALDAFSRAMDQSPPDQDRVSICSFAGYCLKELERFDEALAMLGKGIALDAERTDILNLMGFCYFKQKNHDAAIDCFKKLIQIDPSSAIDYANVASNYRDMGETEKAVYYYQRALAIDPAIEFARENLKALGGGEVS